MPSKEQTRKDGSLGGVKTLRVLEHPEPVFQGRKTMSTNTPTQYESTEHEHTRTRVPVAGGVLVYESRPEEVGRELIGFEEVDDWDELRGALAARGVGVGAIHHKPELDR